MADYEEVIPDSQDEAEIDYLELQLPDRGLSVSPQPRQQTPGDAFLSSSPSFVFPRAMPHSIADTSTISQFSTGLEEISKFTEKSANINVTEAEVSNILEFSTTTTNGPAPVSKKPRPKPRPKFSAKEEREKTNRYNQEVNESVLVPSKTATFTVDIHERVKLRRLGGEQRVVATTSSEKGKEFIAILDEECNPPILKKASTASHSEKRKEDPKGILEVTSFLHSSDQEDTERKTTITERAKKKKPRVVVDTEDDEPVVEKPKRKKKSVRPPDEQNADLSSGKPKNIKRKAKSIGEGAGDSNLEKPGKKRKEKSKSSGAPGKPASCAGDEQQFKSREFILDSDDALKLNEGDDLSAPMAVVENPKSLGPIISASPHKASPFLDIDRMSPLSNLSDEERSGGQGKVAAVTSEIGRAVEGKDKKKKRKLKSDDEEKENAGSKKDLRPSKKSKVAREKERVTEPSMVQTLSTGTAKSRREYGVTSDSEAKAPAMAKDVKATIEEHDSIEEEKQKECTPQKPKVAPPTHPHPPNRPQLASRTSLPHPPKNRPLSAILQRLNSASPRPRASPAVARSFLTRIAPLHPNRRTPPPPPPRVVPKKTKKEIEREEKWEEELQDTVQGWCEMDESERNQLRKQKRNWELGLIEN